MKKTRVIIMDTTQKGPENRKGQRVGYSPKLVQIDMNLKANTYKYPTIIWIQCENFRDMRTRRLQNVLANPKVLISLVPSSQHLSCVVTTNVFSPWELFKVSSILFLFLQCGFQSLSEKIRGHCSCKSKNLKN
jgi:hypothetical protein